MTDAKRRKLPHCEDIIACSSIITYSSRSPNTSDKQIRVNVGLSQCSHDRQGRPKTVLGKLQQASATRQKPRPATAFGCVYTNRGIASIALNRPNVNVSNQQLRLCRFTYFRKYNVYTITVYNRFEERLFHSKVCSV